MNKKIVIAAASITGLLVAGHLGASWYVGQTIRNATDAQLAKLKAEAPFFRIVSQKNDYGLFSSTQEIVIGFEPSCFSAPGDDKLAQDLKDVTFGMRNTIQHG